MKSDLPHTPDTETARPQSTLAASVGAALLCLLALALVGAATTGCGTMGGPASASFASIQVTNRTPAEIRAATVAVFSEAGYRTIQGGPNEYLFEGSGSRLDNAAYGVFVNGSTVIVRFKASLVPLGAAGYRLQGNAFAVRDAGDAVFEDEVRIGNLGRGPYQTLLDSVAARLQ